MTRVPRDRIILCVILAAAAAGWFLKTVIFRSSEHGGEAAAFSPAQEDPIKKYVGEKILYQVKLGILSVGTAEFEHRDIAELNGTAVHVVNFRTVLARFRDNELIYCLPGSLLPVRVERMIDFWPKKERITEEYDQTVFSLKITREEGKSRSEQVIKKDRAIHNAVLLPYYVRTIPGLKEGWRMNVQLPTQSFIVSLDSIEEVKVPAGTFKAYHFTSEPRKFEIWISADEKRIPLKLKGTSSAGYTLLLTGYSI
ncbi:MAG: DUF3108 domain-containing protein [Candidatus Omnitrophota bacterium]|jgi:hypothetical protein|nr:DUF3108 domain-containing protein [Candidatus Omnitrophota bacterium]MDD3982722.1 DUF3108 domain-containing protein [Candidatus Omnitrophota bacterium]MDD5525941.1 DUF3108 domain-containing protein [Candidatus Omnitrophota bacterium]